MVSSPDRRCALYSRARQRSAPVAAAGEQSGGITIAVLPFANLSGDPEQAFFAQGLTEDVILELSRYGPLQVIASASSRAEADRGATVPDIARRFGARYILTGSVRRYEKTARLAIQLTDAEKDRHVWGERYTVDPPHVPELQERIARSVAAALAVRIDKQVLEIARRRPRESLEAYECWLRGIERLRNGSRPAVAEARSFFQRAIEIDPTYARGYSGQTRLYYRFRRGAAQADPTSELARYQRSRCCTCARWNGTILRARTTSYSGHYHWDSYR